MVELIGDICEPSELTLPTNSTGTVGKAGFIFVSGAKLYFDTGTAIEAITSA